MRTIRNSKAVSGSEGRDADLAAPPEAAPWPPPAFARSTHWSPALAVWLSIWLHGAAILGLIAAPSLWVWWFAAVAANHILLGIAGMLPRSRLLGPNISRLPPGPAERGEVALTFDDGPDPDVTPVVLDLLDQHGAKASFFCIGKRAIAHSALVGEIRKRGHDVENHTQNHSYAFACYPPRRLLREIVQAQRAVIGAAGVRPRFFRAPIGLRSPLLDPVLAWTGLRYISWTRRGRDGISRDPHRVLNRLLEGLAAGDIILLHDGGCPRTLTGEPVLLAVLPALLRHLAQRGLKPVSLSQAFARVVS
jgi:peptidoglycan/xylan/chitin deacetylase (PgdA/CDA1 family)